MKGVLIVGHGSRRIETEETLKSVMNMAQIKIPDIPMKIAFMEFGQPDIPTGLDALIDIGADEIAVVPYFLFDGMHIREDIPQIIDDYKSSHSNIQITLGKPLGADRRIADVLAERISGALKCL